MNMLTDAQFEEIDRWEMTEVFPPVIAKQRLDTRMNYPRLWDAGRPYTGAMGGARIYFQHVVGFRVSSVGVTTFGKTKAFDVDLPFATDPEYEEKIVGFAQAAGVAREDFAFRTRVSRTSLGAIFSVEIDGQEHCLTDFSDW